MPRSVCFTAEGWGDYLHWQSSSKTTLTRINALIKEIQRTPFTGTGKPEALRHNLKGCWSRRIDSEHRLVYMVKGEEIIVLQCRYHY